MVQVLPTPSYSRLLPPRPGDTGDTESVIALNEIETLVSGVHRLKSEEGDVVSINLSNRSDITDASLAILSKLSSVRELFLGGCPIGDKGLQFISDYQNLTYLELSDTQITDEGLKIVAGFNQLQNLYLYGCNITDSGLKCLEALSNLKELGLDETEVSADGVSRFLVALPSVDIT